MERLSGGLTGTSQTILAGGRGGFLRVQVQPGEPSGPLTVYAQPTRTAVNNRLLRGRLVLEWGNVDGTTQTAEVDIGAGVALVVGASNVNVAIINDDAEVGTWTASVALGVPGRVAPVLRTVTVGALVAAAESADLVVPAWAREMTLSRQPQNEARVTFYSAAGGAIGSYYLAENTDPLITVPPYASTFRVTNLGAAAITAAYALFELNL